MQRYCDAQGLPSPRAQCDPGYICTGGAYTSTPTDGTTGNICPAGGYCPSGSWTSKPCPPGTYSNTTGATNDKDCRTCDPGYYCMKASGPSPEGPCWAGFYCSAGSDRPNQTEADAGYYAPTGSSSQRPCQIGTYQPFKRGGSCLPCRPGHYCSTTQMKITYPCRAGYYCPEGSEVEVACPVGTYNNFTVQNTSAACIPCPKGKYCSPTAQTYPTGMYLCAYFSHLRLLCFCRLYRSQPLYSSDILCTTLLTSF